MTGYTIMKYLL